MCLQQKVIITDDLADKMTPAKPTKGETKQRGMLSKEARNEGNQFHFFYILIHLDKFNVVGGGSDVI